MIRTRDFFLFASAFIFLLFGISATVFWNSSKAASQSAALPNFNATETIAVAVAEEGSIPREENIARLRQKIAKGEGDIPAGAPIFTSVDDEPTGSDTVVTDQTAPSSTWIGHTIDGKPLFDQDLWRFVGFTADNQVGVALNDVPIYGYRSDSIALDACGGIDEGSGYKLYLRAGQEITPACFVNPTTF